ncbi:SH3 domain-containing protein [Sinomicrobium sp.]
MKVITILICLLISVSSCKKNASDNDSERKLQNKSRGCVEEKFTCDKGLNDVEFALKHFEDVKKCIENDDLYLSRLLTNVQSEVNRDNINNLKLLDSLYSVVDGADAEVYIDVVFAVFKADPQRLIRYLCEEKASNLKKVCVDAVTFYSENEVISNEEIKEMFRRIISDKEIDSCQREITNEILNTVVYYVEDPDGYTNLRAGKGVDFQVVLKVKNKERVNVLNDSGNWWEVEYEGIKGYIHKSRLIK